jgi:hypothetical protein
MHRHRCGECGDGCFWPAAYRHEQGAGAKPPLAAAVGSADARCPVRWPPLVRPREQHVSWRLWEASRRYLAHTHQERRGETGPSPRSCRYSESGPVASSSATPIAEFSGD